VIDDLLEMRPESIEILSDSEPSRDVLGVNLGLDLVGVLSSPISELVVVEPLVEFVVFALDLRVVLCPYLRVLSIALSEISDSVGLVSLVSLDPLSAGIL